MTDTETIYQFSVKYLIVDPFGEVVYKGTCALTQTEPLPVQPSHMAVWEMVSARNVRKSCDDQGAPDGKVLIAAVFPVA